MTRRRIAYIDPQTQQIYCTPEYNGDRQEFLQRGSMDSCDKDWPEIMGLFNTARTLDQFIAANEKAQGFYHSFLDSVCPELVAPVQEIAILNTMSADVIIRLNF
jgi:hypothetical protein